MNKIIYSKDLTKIYGEKETSVTALDKVSVEFQENEFTAIKKFIQTEPSVTKSKYVTKFLNKFDGLDGQF